MAVDRRIRLWRYSQLLRWADQACCAFLLTVGLAAMIGTWIYQGGLQGRLIDIEKADKKKLLKFQLDVNHADWAEWSVLPGIGEMLAHRIVQERENRGPFLRHEDLLRVRGIGQRTLDRMRPYLLPVTVMQLPGGNGTTVGP